MGAGIAKDRAYARMFGTVAPRGLPTMSYFFFFSRDVVTMGASFNIPDPLAEEMTSYGVPKSTADVAAQLFCPVAMQFVTTPMHLLGLDCYNRPSQSFGERVALVAANYRKTVAARIARILPAFGFGGIGNKRCVRAFLRFRVPVGVGWGGDRSWVDWPFLCLGAASHPFPRYYTTTPTTINRFRNEAHAYIRRNHGQQPIKEPVVVLGRDKHAEPPSLLPAGFPGQRGPSLLPSGPVGIPPLVVPGLVPGAAPTRLGAGL